MENFNFELLNNLIILYMGVGIFLIVLIAFCIGYFVYKIFLFYYNSSEELNKEIRKKEIIDTIKEIENNEKK